MPYVYILKCSDGSYYTGSTFNLEQRVWQHNIGLGANYTRKRSPCILVYQEFFESIQEAYLRESQIKKWSKRKKEALIKGEFNKLIKLASTSSANVTR